jgi:hypothetical protein
MYGPDEPSFQPLRRSVEDDWVPGMQALVDVDSASMPALWDATSCSGLSAPLARTPTSSVKSTRAQ